MARLDISRAWSRLLASCRSGGGLGGAPIEVEESVDLGRGVVFSRVWEDGRLAGSDGHVQQRRGWVLVWVEEVISRATAYLDIDAARAAAERLAEEQE